MSQIGLSVIVIIKFPKSFDKLILLFVYFQGVTFPAMTYIISQWAPPLERSRISTIIFMGAQMGNVISLPISGLLCNSVLLGGWPSVFYISGRVTYCNTNSNVQKL